MFLPDISRLDFECPAVAVRAPLPRSLFVALAPPIEKSAAHVAGAETKALRRDVADIAWYVVESFRNAKRVGTAGGSGPIPEKYQFLPDQVAFHELWGCDYHLMAELADKLNGGSRFFLTSDHKDQIAASWPVDIASVYPSDTPTHDTYGPGLALERVVSMNPRDVRGAVVKQPPKIVAECFGFIGADDGEWWTEKTYAGSLGGAWVNIENVNLAGRGGGRHFKAFEDPSILTGTNARVAIMLAQALTARYSWHIALGGDEGGPRLLLPTNPRGCLALFKDRASGASGRRAALRHWVGEHFRQSAQDARDVAYVRDHLRGATRFEWRGLQAELLVSEYDLEMNEFFRVRAAEWRSRRKHNSVRVRFKR